MPTEKPRGHPATCPGRLMLRETAHGHYYLACSYCYGILSITIVDEKRQHDFIDEHVSSLRP